MKICITGGAGFIGTNLAPLFTSQGHQLLLVDNFHPQIHGTTLRDRTLTGGHWIAADVRERKTWQRIMAWEPEAIVHLAAETGTGQSMQQPSTHIDTNILATSLMVEEIFAVPEAKAKNMKLVLASSRAVYGEGEYRCQDCNHEATAKARTVEDLKQRIYQPRCSKCNSAKTTQILTRETAQTAACSIYGWSKLMQEQLVKLAKPRVQSAVSLRFQNVYGEGQSLNNPYTGILAIFSTLLRNRSAVRIFEDGVESRDFVHVSDICKAIAASTTHTGTLPDIINVGSGVGTSVIDVAHTIADFLKADKGLISVTGEARVGDIRHCTADLTLAKKALNFTPQVDFKTGLGRFLEWALSQKDLSQNAEASYKRSLEEIRQAGQMVQS